MKWSTGRAELQNLETWPHLRFPLPSAPTFLTHILSNVVSFREGTWVITKNWGGGTEDNSKANHGLGINCFCSMLGFL